MEPSKLPTSVAHLCFAIRLAVFGAKHSGDIGYGFRCQLSKPECGDGNEHERNAINLKKYKPKRFIIGFAVVET